MTTLIANQMLMTPPSPFIKAVQVPSGMDVAALAALGQMGAVWTGGGTLIAWSSLIAVAGFATPLPRPWQCDLGTRGELKPAARVQ